MHLATADLEPRNHLIVLRYPLLPPRLISFEPIKIITDRLSFTIQPKEAILHRSFTHVNLHQRSKHQTAAGFRACTLFLYFFTAQREKVNICCGQTWLQSVSAMTSGQLLTLSRCSPKF